MLFFNPQEDFVNTLQFINDFTEKLEIKNPRVDPYKISALISGAKHDGHYQAGGVENASGFRKIAFFMSYFISERPIIDAFPKDKIGETLYNTNNHQNAIIALEIAIDSLYGAKIYRDNVTFVLDNKIRLSKHSYNDIIDALSDVTPSRGVKMVAVLLEQMVYRQNPKCEYK